MTRGSTMKIKSADLENYRNYAGLHLDFGDGVHVFYGDNAQGKTNLLEALYLSATNRSYRGAKDKDLIRFGEEEGHIRVFAERRDLEIRIDMHLRASGRRGIAVNGVPLRRAKDFLGTLSAVIFSPEDLQIVKEGPQERRKFIDTELCLLDPIYLDLWGRYRKALDQRNQLLKDFYNDPDFEATLDVWDESLVKYGKGLIAARRIFIQEMSALTEEKQREITGGKEILRLSYEPDVPEEEFTDRLRSSRARDIAARTTTSGPHRDDMSFLLTRLREDGPEETIDARIYGSQGQQRTAALSLKMAEIAYVEQKTGDKPVLFLDDVLSELDFERQKYLLKSMDEIQTFLTCTGVDNLKNGLLKIDKAYQVINGAITND